MTARETATYELALIKYFFGKEWKENYSVTPSRSKHNNCHSTFHFPALQWRCERTLHGYCSAVTRPMQSIPAEYHRPSRTRSLEKNLVAVQSTRLMLVLLADSLPGLGWCYSRSRILWRPGLLHNFRKSNEHSSKKQLEYRLWKNTSFQKRLRNLRDNCLFDKKMRFSVTTSIHSFIKRFRFERPRANKCFKQSKYEHSWKEMN